MLTTCTSKRTQPNVFEDVERPMLRRIAELEAKLAVENPEWHVRDVEATGSCFFLCGNLARQDFRLSPWTSSDEQLREAAESDRLDVLALMLEKLDVPMNDGMTLRQKLELVALVEPFPGPPLTAHYSRCAECDVSTCVRLTPLLSRQVLMERPRAT